jgi:DNA-binding NtrC family response regulator
MGRFEPLNCGTVTDTLAESRLFGTRKGGFSGAPYSEGVFELADKGTLFLDEVQSAPMVVQNMLVRVIEDGRVTPVGGTTKSVDVRVIAASNRDLEALVASGAFREDLLQRLKATVIRLPPLRDRLDDIPALFSHWVTRLNSELPHPCLDMLRGDVRELLQSNLWPGNIREFIAALRDAMLRSRSGVLQPTHFGRATADKPLNDSALTDGLIDFAGLAQQVLAGDVPWQEAMQLQGEYKKELLREVISLHIAQTGSYSHKALAERLTTTSANLRKLCSTYEVYPPRDPKHTRRKEK